MSVEAHRCCWHEWRRDTYRRGSGQERVVSETCCYCGKGRTVHTYWKFTQLAGHGPFAPKVLDVAMTEIHVKEDGKTEVKREGQ